MIKKGNRNKKFLKQFIIASNQDYNINFEDIFTYLRAWQRPMCIHIFRNNGDPPLQP